jgi:hypothetical protein
MDDDIIGQGGDRAPRPWPRRLTAVAALVLALAGGIVYLTQARHQAAPAVSAPRAATASPAPTASAAVSLPPEPNGVAGTTLAWSRDVRLPAAGARPSWFSPASGDSQPIGGLPADQSGYQFTRVGGGWAVQARGAVWFLGDDAKSAIRLGSASLVAPAADSGAAWLTSYPAGAHPATMSGTAREVHAAGGPSRPVRLPSGYVIARGTDRGLLLASASQSPGAAAELYDPATARVVQRFSDVLAASPGEVAWTPRCTARCTVQLLNLATGRHAAVTLPAGNSAASGAFSPDGKFLAVQVSLGNGGDGGDQAMQLEVAGTATGRLTAVPGTWVSSDALVGYGWPADRDSLVAEFNFTTKTQLASWQPGASSPAVTAVPLGGDPAALVLR